MRHERVTLTPGLPKTNFSGTRISGLHAKSVAKMSSHILSWSLEPDKSGFTNYFGHWDSWWQLNWYNYQIFVEYRRWTTRIYQPQKESRIFCFLSTFTLTIFTFPGVTSALKFDAVHATKPRPRFELTSSQSYGASSTSYYLSERWLFRVTYHWNWLRTSNNPQLKVRNQVSREKLTWQARCRPWAFGRASSFWASRESSWACNHKPTGLSEAVKMNRLLRKAKHGRNQF